MRRKGGLAVAAVLSLALAALLAVFAVDVLRWRDSLEQQDVRFLGVPAAATFSPPASLLPFDAAGHALGVEDDLAFRRQLQGFARVRPGTNVTVTQALLALRAETQADLADLARTDPVAARRSRAANMLGVVALDETLAPREAEALADLITGAIGSFRNAVEIDPANSDAKLNLELALRIAKGASLSGGGPSGGRNTGQRAGLGQPGSGY